ncbi:hypothetical protein HZH66_014885 [Vespula vulgaris]|uniref:Uncharacterized protein n=1 Tax=Vespula vulgaris TaxID=7454 RepID=A0A834J2U7_VESVU|nr:hypothetical protein HZH66_014885 [Vespula vulgaris]
MEKTRVPLPLPPPPPSPPPPSPTPTPIPILPPSPAAAAAAAAVPSSSPPPYGINSDWYVDGSKNDSLSRHHVHQKATSHRSTPDTTTTTSPQQKSFPFDDSRDPSAGPRHLTSAPELKDQTLQL